MAKAITITGEHILNRLLDKKTYGNAAENALKRILEVHIAASKRDYLAKKKKTPKYPSMIFDSFTYELKSGFNSQVVGIVMCGGVKAPHAVYVNYPHTLRNGKIWPGYHFMEKGAAFAQTVAGQIIKEELNKALRS